MPSLSLRPQNGWKARGFSEDERAKSRGERSLFLSSNKTYLKVVSKETSNFLLSILFLPYVWHRSEDKPEMGPKMGKGQLKVVQNPLQRKTEILYVLWARLFLLLIVLLIIFFYHLLYCSPEDLI
jgi:hypothetical protein